MTKFTFCVQFYSLYFCLCVVSTFIVSGLTNVVRYGQGSDGDAVYILADMDDDANGRLK